MCDSCAKIRSNSLRVLRLVDPTYTLTLRKTFERKFSKRFRWLKQQITKSIVTNDCFGLNPRPVVTNEPIPEGQFAFERSPDKVNKFMEWLETQINSGILEVYYAQQVGQAIETAWTNYYITVAYQKGITRGRQELKNKGYNVPKLQGSFGLIPTFNTPLHADRVGLLYTRTFEGLKGITNEMSKQIAGILAQNMAEGKGPREIARNINDRVDKIGITRSTILARTEVIRAHHHATIQEYKNWGVEGVTVLAEFVTAGDGRVCPKCKKVARKNTPLGKGVYTLDQAVGLIPVHPNCRCITIPLDITDNQTLLDQIGD